MAITNFSDLAGSSDLGTTQDPQLYAGESDIVTTYGTLLTGVNYAKYTVLGMITASGKYTTYDPAGVDGTEKAVAVLMQPVNTASPAGDRAAPILTGGVLNHQALVWPAATDTLLERQAAFSGTNIVVQQLHG